MSYMGLNLRQERDCAFVRPSELRRLLSRPPKPSRPVGVIENTPSGTKFTCYRNAASQLVESQASDADITNYG